MSEPETKPPGRWVQVPLPERPPEGELIWHYTDSRGLLGMLTNNVLWATATNMLNDGREIQHGLDALGREMTDYFSWREDELHPNQVAFVRDCYGIAFQALLSTDSFVICASTLPDSLSQWRAYAGAGGYAVGLNPNAALTVVTDHPESHFAAVENRISGWRLVLYNDDVITDRARTLFDHIAHAAPDPEEATPGTVQWDQAVRGSVFAINLTIPCIKHEGFADEREVRWTFNGEAASDSEGTTHLRTNNLGLVPYLEVTSNAENPGMPTPSREVRPLPIEEIVIGPCPYPEAASRGLQAALKITGYDDVQVLFSEIPYR